LLSRKEEQVFCTRGRVKSPGRRAVKATQLVTFNKRRKFDFGIFGAKLTTSRLFVEKRNILALIARRQRKPSREPLGFVGALGPFLLPGGGWGKKLP